MSLKSKTLDANRSRNIENWAVFYAYVVYKRLINNMCYIV